MRSVKERKMCQKSCINLQKKVIFIPALRTYDSERNSFIVWISFLEFDFGTKRTENGPHEHHIPFDLPRSVGNNPLLVHLRGTTVHTC